MTSTQATFDPLDESFRRDPFPTLSALRNETAVFRDPALPAVHVLRYAECLAVLQDPSLFTNDFAWAIQPYLESMPRAGRGAPSTPAGSRRDEHRRLRSLVGRAFSAGMVNRIEGQVHELTDSLLTHALEQGEVDLIEAVAYPLPVHVIAEMLGLPVGDRDWFKDWAERFVGGFGSAVFAIPEQHVIEAQVATFREMHDYLRPMVDERRATPGEDLLSRLVLARRRVTG